MFVYFVKAWGECPQIKIGKAKNPHARIRGLQTGCPFKLHILGIVQCKSDLHASQVERMAHQIFHKQRRRGEWFKLSDSHEAAIRRVIQLANEETEKLSECDAEQRRLDREFRLVVG